MKIQTELGSIDISVDVFTSISGWVATNCFGVKGMVARSVSDGFVYLLKRESVAKGVKVTFHDDGELCVSLHIAVEHGVNIPAVCDSIRAEVRYHVEKLTGVAVSEVDVWVDSMLAGSN